MIYLLSGQPGNGKTSKIINMIKAYLEEGRQVYTCGIPKIDLPVTVLSREQVKLWHQRSEVPVKEKAQELIKYSPKARQEFKDAYNKDGHEEPISVLDNIAEGSVIFIDEAQKGFEPTGSNVPEHISYLSEHRHHGLDIVFITQYPFLLHQTVRALITTHWHIRFTWKGRKIHEWPEWQERPQSQTAIGLSNTKPYKIDPTTFKHYESASVHTKVKHQTPTMYYVFIASLVAVPLMVGFSIYRVSDRAGLVKHADAAETQSANTITLSKTVEPLSPAQITSEKSTLQHQTQIQFVESTVQPVVGSPTQWSTVAACVEFKNECRCYGSSGERLQLPESDCRAALTNSWSRSSQQNTSQKATL